MMGFFSGLGSLVSSAVSAVTGFFSGSSSDSGRRDRYDSYSSSSSSSTVTNYDPDKVKVAELENQRIELMKDAQLEIIEFNARMEASLLEAKSKGFVVMQQAMMGMLKEVNMLAEQRLALLEKGSLDNIKQVEAMYHDLAHDIQNDDFLQQKLPELLNLVGQFPEDSAQHKLFMSGVEREIATHFDFKSSQLKLLNERCQTVVNSVIQSKEAMQKHIDEVVVKRIELIESNIAKIAQLDLKQPTLALDNQTTAQIEMKK